MNTKEIENALKKYALELKAGDHEEQKVAETLIAAANILETKRNIVPFDEKSDVSTPPNYHPRRKFTPRRLPPR